LIDMPKCVYSCNRLLAKITSLDEADRAVVAADLLREVRFGDIFAENGSPRRDAEDLECLGVDCDQARVPAACQQGLPEAGSGPFFPAQRQAGEPGRGLAAHAHRLSHEPHHAVVIVPWLGWVARRAAQDLLRRGAEDMKFKRVPGDLVDVHVVQDPVFAEMRQGELQPSRIRPNEDAVVTTKEDRVGERLALWTCDEGLASPPGCQALDLVGREIMEELGAVRPPDLQALSIRPVQDARISRGGLEVSNWIHGKTRLMRTRKVCVK